MTTKRTELYGSNTPKKAKRRSSFLKSGCSCGGFEAVLRKRTKKKSPENRLVTGLFGGELGIRTLEAFRLTAFRVLHLRPLGQLSVYVIPFSFEKLFARTDGKNNKIFNFRTEQKLSVYGDLEGSILPNSQKISSQARYDHFDTLPYSQRIIFYQTKRDLSNNICNIRLSMLKYFSKVRWGNANLQCLSEKVQC